MFHLGIHADKNLCNSSIERISAMNNFLMSKNKFIDFA